MQGSPLSRWLAAGKSELTVLAERFRHEFCTDQAIGRDVNLNDVASTLGVPRRRLYDIVNVLEALQVGGPCRHCSLQALQIPHAFLPSVLAACKPCKS
jgi:hypothetical protein